MKKNLVCLGVLLVSALLLVGCSASSMKNVEQSGFLGDYSQMKQGDDGDAALTYLKPGADFKSYTKIMFERIAVTLAPSSESNEIDPSMLVELTNYYQNALVEAVTIQPTKRRCS